MSTQELLSVVRPTGLVAPDVLLDAIATRTTELSPRDTQLKYRGNLRKYLFVKFYRFIHDVSPLYKNGFLANQFSNEMSPQYSLYVDCYNLTKNLPSKYNFKKAR